MTLTPVSPNVNKEIEYTTFNQEVYDYWSQLENLEELKQKNIFRGLSEEELLEEKASKKYVIKYNKLGDLTTQSKTSLRFFLRKYSIGNMYEEYVTNGKVTLQNIKDFIDYLESGKIVIKDVKIRVTQREDFRKNKEKENNFNVDEE